MPQGEKSKQSLFTHKDHMNHLQQKAQCKGKALFGFGPYSLKRLWTDHHRERKHQRKPHHDCQESGSIFKNSRKLSGK